jgi:NTP pyrophosphatase (non-canonical NTP hydrolase)
MSINKYKFQDAFYALSNCIDHLKLLKDKNAKNLSSKEETFAKRLPNLFEEYLELFEEIKNKESNG